MPIVAACLLSNSIRGFQTSKLDIRQEVHVAKRFLTPSQEYFKISHLLFIVGPYIHLSYMSGKRYEAI